MNSRSVKIAAGGAAFVAVAVVAVNAVPTQNVPNLQINADAANAASGRL